MKISQLPQEIKEKALEYMSKTTDTDSLYAAFTWSETNEGDLFWRDWHGKPNPILTELILYAEQNENAYLLNKLKELQNAGEI